jgi:hypothetical protein
MQQSQSLELRLAQQQQHNTKSASNTASTNDAAVYRRAGLRTPHENAVTDWQAGSCGLWLEHMAETVLQLDTATLRQPSEKSKANVAATRLVWLQTLPGSTSGKRRSSWWDKIQTRHGEQRILAIDCSSCQGGGGGPFGWDNDEEPSESSCTTTTGGSCNLQVLDTVIAAVTERVVVGSKQQQQQPCVLLIDSLTPIIQWHGFRKTIMFLQRLQAAVQSCCRLMVVPVLNETLTAPQHRSLEDVANAILSLSGGEAVLLRQGVRERGNMVRETLPYRIVPTGETRRIELILSADPSLSSSLKAKGVADDAKGAAAGNMSLSSLTMTDAIPQQQQNTAPRRGKVQLQADQGSRNVVVAPPAVETVQPQPHIFMQDDDPEFDDFDEEDPDDDLDL